MAFTLKHGVLSQVISIVESEVQAIVNAQLEHEAELVSEVVGHGEMLQETPRQLFAVDELGCDSEATQSMLK